MPSPYTCVDGKYSFTVPNLEELERELLTDGLRVHVVKVRWQLPVPLMGEVPRAATADEPERIIMRSGSRKCELLRQSSIYPHGSIGVSCELRGNPAPVRSFILHLPEESSRLTGLGLVWILPGEEPFATVTLYPREFVDGDSVAGVIRQAEVVVDEFLSHFDKAA